MKLTQARRSAPRTVRRPLRTDEVAARRRRLRLARRHLEAFEATNRYQAELKGTTLALIRYLEQHWRTPGWAADFDSWWPVVTRYAGVLTTGNLAGPGTLTRLKRLLNRNQRRPTDLQ